MAEFDKPKVEKKELPDDYLGNLLKICKTNKFSPAGTAAILIAARTGTVVPFGEKKAFEILTKTGKLLLDLDNQ
jgi:hypothetical protein